jgi:hypothetical protein
MRRARETAVLAAALAGFAAAVAGCGHISYEKVVVEFDETARTAVLDAVARPHDVDAGQMIEEIRPSYIGIRWRL